MEFRETLLAAQRNQQQKSSDNSYYKARFDPPKKEFKHKDRLSANIQKFLAKKDEEERQKKLEAQKKKEELLAMRDPKALRKIQKSLKVIKSANKSVLEDAVDKDNTAVTLTGPEQPDQDDYGYESQEAAAIYAKMMQKYSKIPEQPKFPSSGSGVKKDLNGTRERVKHALQHEDEPVPHKRRRKGENSERETSPPVAYEPEKKKEEVKPEKPKIRRPLPPPLDFNQLLKIAEQKKSEPIEIVQKKPAQETETDRLMTKKEKEEYEKEMARRKQRQERLDRMKASKEAEKNVKPKVSGQKEVKPPDKEKKPESTGFTRIPKLSDKISSNNKKNVPKALDRERERERVDKMHKEKDRVKFDREKEKLDREKTEREKERLDREKLEREKERLDRERLEKLRLERERIDRDIERLNKDREKLEKAKSKLETKASDVSSKTVDRTKSNSKEAVNNIDIKSQNTYRIDKNANEKKITAASKGNVSKHMNGYSSQGKPALKSKEQIPLKNGVKEKVAPGKNRIADEKAERPQPKGQPKRPDDRRLPTTAGKVQAGSSKPNVTNSFDFDKHVNSLGKNGHMNKNDPKRPNGARQFPPADVRRKPHPDDIRRKQKKRALDSESEYDSELDDFIDDGEEDMDYSKHIKEIFGYDKSKYRDMDDEDDPSMESSFARQQREEYISKKIGIMEDLEDMRMEAMEKKKSKKSRRMSDD